MLLLLQPTMIEVLIVAAAVVLFIWCQYWCQRHLDRIVLH